MNAPQIETAKTVKREAQIWLESIRRFIDEVEAKYLAGYPDIVYPILAGLSQMRHGVKLLVEESSRRIAVAEIHSGCSKVEPFICNLVRFPSLAPEQESLLNLVNLCTSRESRELLGTNLKSKDKTVVLQEQFRLTITGLYEFYNYIVLKGNLTHDLWNELNALLQQIVLLWRQQQQEIEKQEAEKNSLYKNQTITKGVSMTEEEEIAEELLNLFPTHHEDDFADMVDSTPSFENQEKIKNTANKDMTGLITDYDIKVVSYFYYIYIFFDCVILVIKLKYIRVEDAIKI